jgi:ubiquinone/menaquinone biosynthesis C-methylase UbiE
MDQLLGSLKGAAEATRLRIIALLGRGELTVSELTEILGQSQPRVSRHLKLLVESRLLTRFREGSWVFYRLMDSGPAHKLLTVIIEMISKDNPEYIRDNERLNIIRQDRAKLAAEYFADNAVDWDKTRALYVGEEIVECTLLEMLGDQKVTSMIDVGTGTGRMLEIFSPFISSGLGVDLSLDMLTMARSNLSDSGVNNCQVRLGDMYDLPVVGISQDLVVIHQVLHFADDPARAVREASRVLRVSGEIFLVDFAPHDQEFLRDEHAHRRLGFSNEEVIAWSAAAGLSVEETRVLDGGKLNISIWRLKKPTQ